jgi:hypothetical protein
MMEQLPMKTRLHLCHSLPIAVNAYRLHVPSNDLAHTVEKCAKTIIKITISMDD